MLNQELEALLKQIAGGDKSAFGFLYDRTNKLLFSLLMRMLEDSTLAEEVLIDAYLKLWKQAAFYECKNGSAFAWMISITRSCALEKRPAEINASQSSLLSESLCLEISQSGEIDVDFISERHKLVSTILKELLPEQRQILTLAYFSCLNQNEIAERLGLPIEKVKSHLQIGVNKLRERIKLSEDK